MSYFYLGRSPIEDLGYKCVPVVAVIIALATLDTLTPLDAETFGPMAVLVAITMSFFVAAFQQRHGIANGVVNTCAIICAACMVSRIDGATTASVVGLIACALIAAGELAYKDTRGELQFYGSVLLRTLWELILPASFATALMLGFSGGIGFALFIITAGVFLPFAWATLFHLSKQAAEESESSFA